jgi:membrane-associated protein
MQTLVDFFHRLSDLPGLVQWAGLFGLAAIIFSETGLLVGVFLPGDSLLVTAGLFAAKGYLNVYGLAPALTLAAICGNSVGYFIGRATGPRIFRRENSLFFNKNHAIRAHEFYEKYGRKTIVLAQFMPIIRTFAPVVAGVGQMEYHRFLFYNVAGGVGWVLSMTWAGYLLGRAIPNISDYVHIVVVVVIVLSVIPIGVEILRERRRRSA